MRAREILPGLPLSDSLDRLGLKGQGIPRLV
jgi:hypothetical protein